MRASGTDRSPTLSPSCATFTRTRTGRIRTTKAGWSTLARRPPEPTCSSEGTAPLPSVAVECHWPRADFVRSSAVQDTVLGCRGIDDRGVFEFQEFDADHLGAMPTGQHGPAGDGGRTTTALPATLLAVGLGPVRVTRSLCHRKIADHRCAWPAMTGAPVGPGRRGREPPVVRQSEGPQRPVRTR